MQQVLYGVYGYMDFENSVILDGGFEKWLNENMPALVEKIVREEINKIMTK